MPSILLPLGDSWSRYFQNWSFLVSVFLELLGELLPGKFRFVSMKADWGSSVEVPSSAGSVVASNVSVPFSKSLRKLRSRLPMDGFLPAQLLVSDFFLNLRALALRPLLYLEILVQLVCQLTDLPSLRELPCFLHSRRVLAWF